MGRPSLMVTRGRSAAVLAGRPLCHSRLSHAVSISVFFPAAAERLSVCTLELRYLAYQSSQCGVE